MSRSIHLAAPTYCHPPMEVKALTLLTAIACNMPAFLCAHTCIALTLTHVLHRPSSCHSQNTRALFRSDPCIMLGLEQMS
ncbi:hypothetical protein BD310DRAFT_360111 [Dichomitus squalens]|uniref:Uncharacterized protein n=1 Tax=Dichomitus squalens TaxID=114155 RepID=A0A4V2K6B3_9APHY|nr:hypothetical protein BD310DRAFT_360111 [Dichomitus squalens]